MGHKDVNKGKGGPREWLIGDFDAGVLCKPRWPFCNKHAPSPPPFYGPYKPLGIITAAITGLQHALAMAGGLVTPPLLIGMLSPDPATRTYLIQAALLVCGFMTAIQVTGIRFPSSSPYQWGAGILSVMGISFASVPLFTSVITANMAKGVPFDVVFGQLIGTTALVALWPLMLSFLPYRALRKLFPPIVTGVTIFLIGVNLCATGFKYWGGGNFCGQNYKHPPVPVSNCTIPQKNGTSVLAKCYNADAAPLCDRNGDVKLPFGSAPYVGMGFMVFSLIILIELFGSPFMRSAALVIALLVGTGVAAVATVDGNRFFNGKNVQSAPAITFLWVKRFPLGFYPAAILPLIIVLTITSVETVGDVTATTELSLLPVEGADHVRRIRGGMFNDAVSCMFSALAGSMPMTTFAQNNGVISLTGVASRWAGWAAAAWLVLFGLLGKFGGLVLSIPDCVLGGATSFLFAAVTVSGIKIFSMGDGFSRRNRFILSCALALGMGVTMVPQWAENNLWPETPGASPAATAARMAVLLILETGFCVGALVAFILNMIMPTEADPALVTSTATEVSCHHITRGADVEDQQLPELGARSPDSTVRSSSTDVKVNLATAAPAMDAMNKDAAVGRDQW